MKKFIQPIIIVAAALLLLRTCTPYLSGPNPLIGQSAPDFTLDTLSGGRESMHLVRQGKPAVLFFWATWCPHCREALNALKEQKAQIDQKGISIVLIDVGEEPQKVKVYLDANGIPFDVLMDKKGSVGGSYKIIGLPTFFFINREGVIIDARHSLPSDYDRMLLGLGA